MASRYWGITRGVSDGATGASDVVTEGSSTTSKSMELVLDLTANFTRAEVIEGLKKIENWIMKGNWPPA